MREEEREPGVGSSTSQRRQNMERSLQPTPEPGAERTGVCAGEKRLTRRAALGRAATAGVAGMAAMAAIGKTPLPGAIAACPEEPAPRGGRIRQSICRWCHSKLSLDELAKAAADMGYQSIELIGPADWPVVKKYGLTCAMTSGAGTIGSGLNRKENHERCLAEFRKNIPLAAEAGLPNVICFSGNRAGMPDDVAIESCVAALKEVVGLAEERKVTICMELLNSKVDHADYQCDRSWFGVEVAKRVSSPRFKLLYDIYHMQIMEGDLIRTIRKNIEYIGHFHTGGNPGRNEIDDSQEIHYPAVLRAIAETGYAGYVAQEFVPKGDSLVSLRQAFKICDV